MTLLAGTSGWSYREWKPLFYPEKLPQSRWLEHYCGHLPTCEINATFYRLQEKDTLLRWLSAAPDGFKYVTKAHRRITHRRALAVDDATRAFMTRYFESISLLGPTLGAVLYQFPPTRTRDDDALRSFLESLPTQPAYALEFRDDSWNDSSIGKLVADSGGTVCVSNSDGSVPELLPPGPIGYVRLRAERYTTEQRKGWRSLLQTEAGNRPVFVFVKHEGIPADDAFGGIGLARWLVENA
jgi:uncharacterized protein YecE (DUF72 family)